MFCYFELKNLDINMALNLSLTLGCRSTSQNTRCKMYDFHFFLFL